MDIHRLRVLRAVVADGSIRGAATSLGYTPSAISQHITALQKETGLTLVQRTGRSIEPTAAGRTVAAQAARVFERIAELESVVSDLRAGRVGALSVSYFASAGAVWIPPMVATLAREFPGLRLDLRLIELVGADAGPPDVEIFVDGTEPADIRGYRVRSLLTEPYFAVVPQGSALADRIEVDLAELRDEAWVDNDVARGACRQAVLDACSTVGFSPAFHIETQDYPTAIKFVAEGMGITVIPRLGLGALPASTVAVPIVNPTPRRSISVRVRDAVADHPAAVRLLELLDTHVRRTSAIESAR
ncbi:LysR family transcriptional regulator [Kutzneria buriramensis]|uniref:DNA-binding transcriptional LysR family regulator n=1 Tax=Kutzneria buriramensis TaxID=1045776 RepID=A0A3E0HTA7_9PSEU|nr:LysR family transcriptional regulator [Kutzneria buriramensis]REH49802.1 DNA-binding transcriptional LysR family regulator [Kutzneria buriramensis]